MEAVAQDDADLVSNGRTLFQTQDLFLTPELVYMSTPRSFFRVHRLPISDLQVRLWSENFHG